MLKEPNENIKIRLLTHLELPKIFIFRRCPSEKESMTLSHDGIKLKNTATFITWDSIRKVSFYYPPIMSFCCWIKIEYTQSVINADNKIKTVYITPFMFGIIPTDVTKLYKKIKEAYYIYFAQNTNQNNKI